MELGDPFARRRALPEYATWQQTIFNGSDNKNSSKFCYFPLQVLFYKHEVNNKNKYPPYEFWHQSRSWIFVGKICPSPLRILQTYNLKEIPPLPKEYWNWHTQYTQPNNGKTYNDIFLTKLFTSEILETSPTLNPDQ